MRNDDSTAERALSQFGTDVWVASEPVRILGMKLSATMTVVRLPNSGLLLFSPIPATAEHVAAVEALGKVQHLYAPNTFHHRWVGQWSSAFPTAYVHGPLALKKKRPDLKFDRFFDRQSLGELDEVFDEVHIDGFALEESVLVHRPSGTLLVADLVQNIGRPSHWWTAAYSRAMGFYDRAAISRMLRWTAFGDPVAARRSLDRLSGCRFDRLVVGHGEPLTQGARAALVNAYAWLRPERKLLPARTRTTRRGSCG